MKEKNDENGLERYGFYGRLSSQFPSQIIIDVTEVCNLACTHCPHPAFKASDQYDGRHLDSRLNIKIVDEVKSHGQGFTQFLRYTSMGEPLVHPKIFEMLEYAKTQSGVLVALTTNGKIMREKQVESLLDIGIDLIDISIDAFTPETYSKIRVGGDLATTRNNVLRLLQKKKDRNSSLKVVVSFIEQSENLSEVKDFESFWKSNGADYVVVRKLHSAAGAKKEVAETLWQATKTLKRKPCVYPWERIVLSANGKLSFCPADWTHGATFVDYSKTTVKDEWNGEFYSNLRLAHLENNFKCHGFCGQCPDWSVIRWPDEGRGYADMVEEFKREGADILSK